MQDKNDAITRMTNQYTETNQQITDKVELLKEMTDEIAEKNQKIKNTMGREKEAERSLAVYREVMGLVQQVTGTMNTYSDSPNLAESQVKFPSGVSKFAEGYTVRREGTGRTADEGTVQDADGSPRNPVDSSTGSDPDDNTSIPPMQIEETSPQYSLHHKARHSLSPPTELLQHQTNARDIPN
jgi:hypothetical protein